MTDIQYRPGRLPTRVSHACPAPCTSSAHVDIFGSHEENSPLAAASAHVASRRSSETCSKLVSGVRGRSHPCRALRAVSVPPSSERVERRSFGTRHEHRQYVSSTLELKS
eukprot:768149-Hanusia_phi.AAC.2